MKTGKNLAELSGELIRQYNSSVDLYANSGLVSVVSNDADSVELSVSGKGNFAINPLAHNQIADVCEIPRKYYNKMLAHDSSLLASNVNKWLHSEPKTRLFRTLDSRCRAVLSDKYMVLDNAAVAENVLPVLASSGAEVVSCDVTDTNLYIKAVTPRLTFDIAKGDPVQAGIVISNSEVGCGSFRVEALLYRLVCTNGLISANDRYGYSRAHLTSAFKEIPDSGLAWVSPDTHRAATKAVWSIARDLVSNFFAPDNFEGIVERFRQAKVNELPAPVDSVAVVQKKFGLTEDEHNSVLQHLLSGGELNQFGMVNAITRSAQDVSSYERATELERLGGRVLELRPSEWSEIAVN